ncbi:uncharacterized protein LOC119440760 [Dermacentor silvarum]|uniref:uncharacterized protein LOC119440760 n=1 Tax=Dermacentor silvarum TaxID=543639 RepID=UPI0021014132|nr:uncharacterized protein LOC119440760 [Dermacentor silvarum]
MWSTNPLLFFMQVLTSVIMRMPLPLLAKSTSVSVGRSYPCFDDVKAWDTGVNRDSIRPATPPVMERILDEMPLALLPSSTTIQLPIKEERLPLAHCGLGGIATMWSTNPLLFFMQVCEPRSLYAKKTNNYSLVQLPSPQCCLCIVSECLCVIRCLLLLSGDIENSERTTQLVHKLDARVDDAENRSRRNNLIFYGLPDPSASEPSSESEKIILRHCSDHLKVSLDPKEIERAHRIGRYSPDRKRPIIVKFVFFKTKEAVLSNGRNFKGTDFSVAEDFSPAVRNARKHLVAFAKAKSVPFSLRFKTLFIGSKRYVYDEASQTIKEV